jgi:asparagine synthase (glutamine-hydrolysing)
MCGICGYVGSNTSAEVLRLMTNTLQHRGPDDSGYYFDAGQVALGMRRLSIIDVEGGKQPIFNEGSTLVVVFNGEIYNFVQMRTDLEAKGHQFTTRTDTEVIVHGYEECGLKIFEKLNGMFGIAIWDQVKRRLILARDRIGIKPIYYAWINKYFVFASEIKAIIRFPGFVPKLDLVALDGYLSYQYAPAPLTLFKGVRKLLPGHFLIVEPENPNMTDQAYWQFEFKPLERLLSDREWIEELRITLDSAVRSHLVSDVPLGAFLSGGVDSSSIVALMCRVVSRPVKTFTVGFMAKNPKNELSYARAVARELHTDHHELMVAPDMVHQLPELIWHMDEPMGDPAALPTFFVSKLAKECGVKVALSGEGADEMFAGYPKYWLDGYLRLYQKLPRDLRRTISFSLEILPRFERQKRLLAKVSKASNGNDRLLCWRKVGFPDHYRERLLTDEVRTEVSRQADDLVETYLSDANHLTDLQKMLHLDTLSWLPDDLLMKVDRMSMAASIEARVPYLDNNVIALAERMPDTFKMRGPITKYLLKEMARKLLPNSIVDRPKHGFELPLDEWIRGELGEHFRALLLDESLSRSPLFNKTYITELLDRHSESKADHGPRIWMLGNLQLWLDRFGVSL